MCKPVWEIRPARADGIDRRLQGALVAGALDDRIGSDALGLVLHPRRHVDLRRVDDVAHVEAASQVGPGRVHLGDHHPRAELRGVQRGEDDDGPGSGDQHRVAGSDPGHIHPVRGDRGRFHEGALKVGDAVGQRADMRNGDDREFRDTAPVEAQADARHRDAQVVEPAPAVVAGTAVEQRHDRYPLTDPHLGHVGPDLHDLCGELVPEDLRELRAIEPVRLAGDDDRPHGVLVQIRTADAAPERADEHLTRSGRRRVGDVLDADVVLPMEHRCLHVNLPAWDRKGSCPRAARRRAGRAARRWHRAGGHPRGAPAPRG